ncbi:hypothetical protein TPA0906_66800 [Streptomyces olivaceus]|uniref:hypothetical protein n=1 Tax=Streptomyces olivaceus TaxID=47716 RepID=UPI0022EE0AB1|nr:hypothetical protein [Streptomyces olivaceus]GHJ04815.1 hypothetical protein TPA0906_66800 [Streptomyces olivaceus]
MGREYVGTGGLRLHLDEPVSPQIADQIRKGHLVPVADSVPDEEPEAQSPAGHQAGIGSGTADDGPKRPNANSKVDDWRAYALSLGMPEEDAADATKTELQDWVKVADSETPEG